MYTAAAEGCDGVLDRRAELIWMLRVKAFGFEITGRVLKWVGFERDMDLLNFGIFFPSIN